ncbi:MAG: hypothetical protein HC886_18170 [Leptolyngbyaceae cyanobacterium SM1_1_3]|nr:hypothetical protein [Leptolyngbyaceae cyanobacterium SM1_1_3]NJO11324.1 hypothetical protein [Leptolyngbyaceae cyanobacterium SL_1_1]
MRFAVGWGGDCAVLASAALLTLLQAAVSAYWIWVEISATFTAVRFREPLSPPGRLSLGTAE